MSNLIKYIYIYIMITTNQKSIIDTHTQQTENHNKLLILAAINKIKEKKNLLSISPLFKFHLEQVSLRGNKNLKAAKYSRKSS